VKDYSNQGLLQSFRYIRFATHGLVSDELPALTSVVLAPDPSGQDDGFLTVGEFYGLTLNSDLSTGSRLPQRCRLAGRNNAFLVSWQIPNISGCSLTCLQSCLSGYPGLPLPAAEYLGV
jgi:hypothetical protein